MRLDRVSKGERIRADDWNRIVDAINGTPDNSIAPRKKAGGLGKTTFAARRVGNWTFFKNVGAFSLYQASADVYKDVFNKDSATRTTIYAFSNPDVYWLAVSKINGKWIAVASLDIKNYSAGDGLALNGTEFSNAGVTKISIANNGFRVGDVEFNEDHFAIGDGTAFDHRIKIKDQVFPYPKITATAANNALTLQLEF